MIKTADNKKYYIYDLWKHEYCLKCTGLEEFLICIARNKSRYKFLFSYDKPNDYIDNVNMNGNDKFVIHYADQDDEVFLRRYMFFDEDMRIIDIRNYKKAIDYYREHLDILFPPKHQKVYGKDVVGFRKSPAPYTGRGHFFCMFRHPKTLNEKKMNSDPDYKQYVRAKRRKNRLPSDFDDILRPHVKSWKEQGKKRRQWM